MNHNRSILRAARPLLSAIALVAAFAMLSAPANAASSTFSAPVYGGDFPDPSVILVPGSASVAPTYWAYSTGSAGRNLQVMSSTDLQNWSAPTDPLKTLPTAWASSGATWAPGVVQLGSTFVMYYTVHDKLLGHQCISVATSQNPAGQFNDSSAAPLICQTANGGSIDPNPYLDPASGKLYLLWKSDDNSLPPPGPHPTHLWGQQLASDGLSLASGTSPSLLLTQSANWQSPAIEGPAMIRNSGRYYLFYGANNYDSADSGVGYATSSSVLGPFTNRSNFERWLGTRGNAQGAQGPTVFTDTSGVTRMAFAAWYGAAVGYENRGVRSFWIGALGFTPWGAPSLS